MDPFKSIHEHVHGLILQHFTVDELLEFSLIAKSWNSAIGKSNLAMKKIWLNVGDRFNEPMKDDLKALRASDRNYQNFKISEIENGLQFLLFPPRSWKRAVIDIQSFTPSRDFFNLLQICNKTIEHLEICDMDIEPNGGENLEINFPELRKLRIGFVTSIALKPFVQNLPKLEKLMLEEITDVGVKTSESAKKMVQNLLMLQPQLTVLSLSSFAFCKLFESAEDFPFRLKCLLVEYSVNSEDDSRENSENGNLENFIKFLNSQEKLVWVMLCEWTCRESLQVLFSHPTLDRISFEYFDGDSEKLETASLKLNANQNIRYLDINCEDVNPDWVHSILKAAPNAVTLYFFHVSQELFEYVATNMMHLKYLKFCSIFKDHEEFYRSLKTKGGKVNCDIEIIEDKFVDLKQMIEAGSYSSFVEGDKFR